MSEPMRYAEVSNDWNGEAAGLAPSADGEWVKYEDYAALLAKVERLTKAGIAMGMALPDTDEANAAYRSFERVVKS